MAVTELTHPQLVLQGGVGEDHHLWRGGSSGEGPAPGERGRGEMVEEGWCEASGSPYGFAGSALYHKYKVLPCIRFSPGETQ